MNNLLAFDRLARQRHYGFVVNLHLWAGSEELEYGGRHGPVRPAWADRQGIHCATEKIRPRLLTVQRRHGSSDEPVCIDCFPPPFGIDAELSALVTA